MNIGEKSRIHGHFYFLNQLGFDGPKYIDGDYTFYADYIKSNIEISITYQGRYRVYISKLKDRLNTSKPRNEQNEKSIKRVKESHHLSKLDKNKKVWNSVSNDNFPDKYLWYYAKLIKNNLEILDGDFKKFYFWYRLLNRLGIIKYKLQPTHG